MIVVEQLRYGGVPVPFTASWSAEDCGFHVARCPHARRDAICQAEARGQGKPKFGSPHAQRQRQVISLGLCDLCGRSLKGRAKVSLSHAGSRANGAAFGDILQVEPLLHKEGAAVSLLHCPSLKRDVANGSVRVRLVTRYAVQMAIMSEVYVQELTGEFRKAVGHAKVQLLGWSDRDAGWLGASAP